MSRTVERVLFYTPGWPVEKCHNGIVSYIAALRGGLRKRDVRSKVFTNNLLATDDPDAVDFLTYTATGPLQNKVIRGIAFRVAPEASQRRYSARCMAHAIRDMSRDFKPDLVEMEETYGMAAVLKPQLAMPLVVRLHGPWFLNGAALGFEENAWFRRRVAIERRAIVTADAITSPCKNTLDQVRDYYGLELARAEVIPNPAPDVAPEMKWKPTAHQSRKILFVGRFDRHKGGDIMLRAFDRVVQKHPDSELIFVGPGEGLKSKDGSAIGIDDFIANNISPAAQQRIRLTGLLDKPSIEALRQQAAVTVIPSRYEVFPMTVLESLAFGAPTIAARTGGIPEVLEDGKNGFLFTPENVDELSEKISTLLDSEELATQFSHAARATIAEGFSVEVVARRMMNFYGSVLSGQDST
jgi:glycosyltransferase involved in cell wall biosynthesis